MPAIFTAAALRCGELIRRGSHPQRPGRRRPAALLAAAALAALVAMGPAQRPAEAATKASHFVLSNGMEVVVVPNDRVPIVMQQLWYKVGWAEDPEGQTGL